MNSFKNTSLAWSVHIFTALGVVCAMLATIDILESRPSGCIFWLAIALIVDGIDGTFARHAKVKEMLPNFDGSILDLVVDYLNYVFVPALFIYKYNLFPEGLAKLSIAIILISSLYCFCNVKMKSSDYYFVGFPAVWNVVALYFYVLDMSNWANFAITVVLAVLTVSELKFLHPFRVKTLMPLNIFATILWFIGSALVVMQLPSPHWISLTVWWIASIYFALACAIRSLQDWRK